MSLSTRKSRKIRRLVKKIKIKNNQIKMNITKFQNHYKIRKSKHIKKTSITPIKKKLLKYKRGRTRKIKWMNKKIMKNIK